MRKGNRVALFVCLWAVGLALLFRLRVRPFRAAPLLVMLALTPTPLLLPTSAMFWRALTAGFAVALTAKAAHRLAGPPDLDPALLVSPGRYLLFLLVPPRLQWPPADDVTGPARLEGSWRLRRASIKGAALIALTYAQHTATAGTPVWLCAWLVPPALFYCALTGLADALTGAVMLLTGATVEENFRDPLRSASLAELWGRRWNLFIHRLAHRWAYLPARRAGRVVGVLAAFAASGLFHEYLVVAIVGWQRYRPGWMMAFFLIHGVAVCIETALPTRPPYAVKRLLVLAFVLATTPLFFLPLQDFVAAFTDVWWGLLQAAGLAGAALS